MGLTRAAFKTFAYASAAGTGTWLVATRNSKMTPLAATDPILASPAYNKYNPNRNPAMQDVCIKRVPLAQIKPQLLEHEGRLVEAFCAGIWSGIGFAPQLAYLARKYQSPSTSSQLWTPAGLSASRYDVGTRIADHFEVVAKTRDAITVRCGDSPRVQGVRESDGLFAMAARVKREEGVVEFRLTSVFYRGLGRAEGKPMPGWMEGLHRLYTKLWMETATRSLTV